MSDELIDYMWNEFRYRINKYFSKLGISGSQAYNDYIINDYSDNMNYLLVSRDNTPHVLFELIDKTKNVSCITVFINRNGFEFIP